MSFLILISSGVYSQENPWENIGPFGGDINSMAMDNEHPDTVYAATPSGLFRSMDGTENWAKLTLPDLEVDNVVISQNQSNMVICNSEFNVFLSNDYGENWNVIWSDTFRVKCIAFNPLNPKTIVVGTDNRHHTTNGWQDPDMDTPYFYKSTNRGSTWDKVYFSGLSQSVIPESLTNIIIDPSDTSKIYISGDSSINCGIYTSHNNGADWTYKFTYSIYAMACTPAGYEDHTICAITGKTVISYDRILLISKDAGVTWEEKYPPSSFDMLGNINSGSTIYINPDDPKYIDFGMEYEYVYEDENYSSSVGAYNIEDDKWYYFESCPNSFPSSILMCNEAFYLGFPIKGVYKYEGNHIWSEKNRGLCSVEVLDLAPYPESPEKIITALENNLFKTNNMGQSWTELGDTYNDKNSIFIFPNDTAKLIAGIHSGWLSYGNSFYIYKSDDGGKTWDGQKLFTQNGNITQDYKMWVSEIVGSPTNPDVIFIGVDGGDASSGAGIYKSNDGGSSWEIKRTTGVSAIAVDPVNNDIVYSGTSYAGYVNRSEDAGDTWTEISPGGQDNFVENVNDLAVDNSQQVFAATTSGLYIWEGNEDWALVPGFPVTNTTAIVIDNSLEEPVYYVGTSDQGVFISTDSAQTWQNFNNELGSSNITKLKISDPYPKYLYAATKNAGTWVTLLQEIGDYRIKEYVSICEGEDYEGWTETGEYERLLVSAAGTDSLVVTYLTVNPVYEYEEDITICEGEVYNGLTTEGQHRRELESIYNCDSVIITNLTIDTEGINCYNKSIHVPSAEYPTIQSAMDAANPGDTVLVADGTYTGEGNLFLTFRGKAIVVKSENGPENCIIDCVDGTGIQAFLITNGESRRSVVDGFKIINGCWVIMINESSPVIRNNIFKNNNSGVHCEGSLSTPLIENNIISQCNEDGIYFERSTGIIQNNTISRSWNEGMSGIRCNMASPTIQNNTIELNTYGIFCEYESNPLIEGNIITENYNEGIQCSFGSSPQILKNQITANRSTGIYCFQSSPQISRNLIKTNGGNTFSSTTSYTYDSHQRLDEVFVGGTENGGISLLDRSNPNIQNNIITENKGTEVGAIFCDEYSMPTIVNNHIFDNSSINGGSIFAGNSSAKIINNIISGSKSDDKNNRLSRWYKDNLFAKYTYDGVKLDYVTYYFGFINNGEPGEVQISGCTGLNELVWAETGEMFWIELKSGVSTYGDGGGLKAQVSIEGSSFNMEYRRPDPNTFGITHGCSFILSPVITSNGTSTEGTVGAGIVARNSDNLPQIAYNNVFGNLGSNYIYSDSVETKKAQVLDLTGTDGNISSDPLVNEETYELLEGSPCIDAGTPDTTDLGLDLTDFLGNPRILNGVIDIGAVEMQSSTIQTKEYKSICQGEEYEGHTESSTFQRTLTSATGIDSIVTTYLTVNPTYESEEYVSVCEGEDYLGLTEAGNHQRQFETVNGCDSIMITHLTVNAAYSSEESVSICEGDNYLGFTQEGDHQREFESVDGCDSIVVTHLLFYPPFKPTYETDEDTLTSLEIYSGYQWFNEDGPIDGATSREYIIEKSGDYYLKAQNENGCFYNSDTIFVRYSYTWDISQDGFTYSVMPNPNNGNFSFRIDQNPPAKLTLKLVNTLGQEIETKQLKFPEINQTEQFNVSYLSKGIYQLIIYTDSFKDNRKIVIN